MKLCLMLNVLYFGDTVMAKQVIELNNHPEPWPSLRKHKVHEKVKHSFYITQSIGVYYHQQLLLDTIVFTTYSIMCTDTASPCMSVTKLQADNQRLESESEKLRLQEENSRLRWELERMKLVSKMESLSTLVKTLESKLKEAAAKNEVLTKKNEELESNHYRIQSRQKLLLRHFACISHEIRTPLVSWTCSCLRFEMFQFHLSLT